MESQSPNKRIPLILFAIVGGIIVLFGLWKLTSSSSSSTSLTKTYDFKLTDSDWVKGNKQAKVVLMEYSDFQCPACAAYHPLVKELLQKYGDKMAFVYRHFPLSQHKNAAKAAYAAEAAGRQEKFWPMHNLIFENQEEWAKKANAEEIFINYAESINLDLNKFKTDLNSSGIKEKVNNDYFTGQQANVTYTPTFYLNGEKITNPQSFEEFENMIENELKKST